MKLVAVVRAPQRPEDAARVLAGAGGLTLAEARMRLAPEPPALVARLEPGPAVALVAALRQAGAAAVAVDTRVPSDADRLVARTFALEAQRAAFTARSGEVVEVAWGELLAVLRGQRATRSTFERKEVVRRFSAGAAIATGGLVMSRKTTTMDRTSSEAAEQVILVYPRQGGTILLAETQVDFSCLGPDMQASSTANMGVLAARLRERAPGAFHDDRLVRLGRRALPFVAGGESRFRTASVTASHADTSGTLDVLAEILRTALVEGLLR